MRTNYFDGESCLITYKEDLSDKVIIENDEGEKITLEGDDIKKFIASIMIAKLEDFGNFRI